MKTKTLKKQVNLEKIVKDLLKKSVKTRDELNSFKREVSQKYKIPFLDNMDLLSVYHQMKESQSIKKSATLESLLQKKPIRSLSGIVNVSVLTKPYPCPGRCIFCPTQKGAPKSYLKKEPAVQRAVLTNFHPFKQVITRLDALKKTGHPVDKIELRIIGGTWSYYPKNYQTWFLKECFRAANIFNSPRKTSPISRNYSLRKIQRTNERANCRIVGLTVETRPDFIDPKEIKRMRQLAITRVELGVQSIYDKVLNLNQRDHLVKDTVKATKLLKQAGFKVSYQIMLNLPGSDPKKDLQMVKEIFSNPDFCPDLLKIYPLALVKNTPLYQWYQKKKFKPYDEKELTELLVKIKQVVPFWCRIERVIRDIPSEEIIEGGAKKSNLREIVQRELQKRKKRCRCIRCRQVTSTYNKKDKLKLLRKDYKASEGREIFLSFETEKRKKLYALLRLRLNKDAPFDFLKNSAIIREVHTYGALAPIGKKIKSPQHKGLGKKLIEEAERIAKQEFGLNKIYVIAAVGTRDYYRKLGYRLKETYMEKNLSKT